MDTITLRFYADLGFFLPPPQRGRAVTQRLNGPASVKDRIEAAGVPHTEVAAVLVNGTAVDFDYRVQPGDRVAVYPPFTALGAPDVALRPPLPLPPRFVADNHIGRLARYLRLLGLDTVYSPTLDDPELAAIAHAEQRVLLTRDRRLLMRREVVYGYCLRTTDTREQLRAVVRRYDLARHSRPWRRCLRCNGLLHVVAKADVLDRLEPLTKLHYEAFRRCAGCGQVYWDGSHTARLSGLVRWVLDEGVAGDDSAESPSAPP